MSSVHVAYIGLYNVDTNGNVVRKDDPNITIAQQLRTSTENRIIPDSNIPNSASYPTIKQYLESEASDNYELSHLDQNMIVTYLRA